MNSRRSLSLSEQLNQIANPEPVFNDPEDDFNLESTASNITKDEFYIEKNEDQVIHVSKLRRKSAPNLSDINARYSGQKIDRKALERDDSDDSELMSEEDNDEEEFVDDNDNSQHDDDEHDDDDSDENEKLEFYNDNLSAPRAKLDEDSSNGTDKTSSNEIYSEEDSKPTKEISQKDDLNEEENDYITQFSNIDVQDEISKGQAVKNQLLIWDNLLECRIKMQKMLIDSNKYPQFNILNNLTKDNSQVKNSVKNTTEKLKDLLEVLLKVDHALQSQNKSLFLNEEKNDLDEEITSESDNEKDDSEDDGQDEIEDENDQVKKANEIQKSHSSKRKLEYEELENILSKRHKNLIPVRNDTIDKWFERTRYSTGNFNKKTLNLLEQSATKQIQHILTDRERLIRKTQMKRSIYNVIGKKVDNVNDEHSNIQNEKEYDTEIFDDDDFYHQLLRELIERKTGDSNDPIVMNKRWIEIERIRSKMNKRVDTKASKGRKVRYEVHPKLVNFMAPVQTSYFSQNAKDELFNSLFGKGIVDVKQ